MLGLVVAELIDGARMGGYRGTTLGLHEGSLELDANDKGRWTRQDLQGIECPQSEYDMHEKVVQRM